MKRKIFFRFDVNAWVGTGHFYRAINIAKALLSEGHDCTFLCGGCPEEFEKIALKAGIEVLSLLEPEETATPLGKDQNHWLQLGVDEDSLRTKAILETRKPDILFVDHYSIDRVWQKCIPIKTYRVVIDDLANREHHCDLLLDQNEYLSHQQRYKSLVPKDTKVLSGARYALLGAEFSIAPRPQPRQAVKKVLVNYGSVDPTGEILKVLKGILTDPEEHKKYHFKVIAGPLNSAASEIEALIRPHDNMDFLSATSTMRDEMRDADFAFGAGGTMNWERASQGLPMILTSVAENQTQLCEDFAQLGFCKYLGTSSKVTSDDYLSALKGLETTNVQEQSERLLKLVDGKGIPYLLEALKEQGAL